MDIPGKSCRKINISGYAREFHEDDSAGIEFADSSNCAVRRTNLPNRPDKETRMGREER